MTRVVTQSDSTIIVDTLMQPGGVVVLRTDTLYGIVARADDEAAVENVYRIKSRNQSKSCIVLLASPNDAYDNQQDLSNLTLSQAVPTSFLLTAQNAPSWLCRQNDELAYRVPALIWLRDILQQTGPLIAPSANPESLPPAMNIAEAQQYFGDDVSLYVDGGSVLESTPPSRLVRVHPDGGIERLR